MTDSMRLRLTEWGLDELMMKHTSLRIEPSPNTHHVLTGTIAFHVIGPRSQVVEDDYDVRIRVDPRFPAAVPRVFETSGRIPEDYHKLEGGSLCLAAPTALRMRLAASPSLLTFVDEFVVPYLAGYTHFSATGKMLFGELKHGVPGIREYLAELFKSKSKTRPEEFIRLASMKKRCANKCECPCGSGKRLGKCHNRIVNALRIRLGKNWFASEYQRLQKLLPAPDAN